jgi:N-acetyl-anhydromuramyl-L-alanine amidase AmpD
MPSARIERIIFHWTAGAHRASGLDKSHYHILIEVDGKLVRGTRSIAANGIGGTGQRASHTLDCNTGSIGVSLCCMAGAIESPFKAGSAPMTAVQWKTLADVLADLCRRYGVPVTPKTVLSHAEVQSNLGIRQRGKWDIARLAFDPSIVGAKACGDAMRVAVSARL